LNATKISKLPSSIIAKAVVLGEKGTLLLLRRSPTDKNRPGEWDFPGGYLEPGEEITAGVRREILEEAGLKVKVLSDQLIYAATFAYPQLSATRLLFQAKYEGGEVKLSFEHDSYKWVDYATALKLFPHPFYAAGLKYALDHGLISES